MSKKNRVMMIEVFRGISPGTRVFFHRKDSLQREYTPTQNSLDRLEPHLKGGEVYLNVDAIMIHKWP